MVICHVQDSIVFDNATITDQSQLHHGAVAQKRNMTEQSKQFASVVGSSEGTSGIVGRSTYGVVRLNERVVDSNNLDVGVLDGVAEDDTADTTETVDADLDGSHFVLRRFFW
jgi:hypothetical protein